MCLPRERQATRPVRELNGYARVALEAGEEKRVTFRIHADRTSFTGVKGERIIEPGTSRCRWATPAVTCRWREASGSRARPERSRERGS
ncbi:fibronectin type III-like domain-contianing protein [Glycomyces buryatensis]